MTADEVAALSNEELRVKVAELCGWVLKNWPGTSMGWRFYHEGNDEWLLPEQLPDYARDLNAIHEADGALAGYARALFDDTLLSVCNPNHDRLARDWLPEEVAAALHANVRQRAIAFILTMQSANSGERE